MGVFVIISNTRAIELIQDYRENNNQKAIEELYLSYQTLMAHLGNKYSYLKNIDYEGEMNVAFTQAIESYKLDSKASFNTYFKTCVDNRIKVKINEMKAYKRTADMNAVSYNNILDDEENNEIGNILNDITDEINYEEIEKKIIISKAVSCLTPIERQILALLSEGYSMAEIARKTNRKDIYNILKQIKYNKKFRSMLSELNDTPTSTFVIVDGTSMAMRALKANTGLTTKDGIPTGYIYTFIRMLHKILKMTDPTHIVFAWDVNRNTWRKQIYADYKANRTPMSNNTSDTGFKIIKDILDKINIKSISNIDYEGDDICGSLVAKSTATHTIVVSGDQDLLQLIEPSVEMLYLNDYKIIDQDGLYDMYEVTAQEFILLKTLMGDKSDNIPGIDGIAIKGAIKLVHEFKTLENLLNKYMNSSNLTFKQKDNIKKWENKARLFYKLVKIRKNVPIQYTTDDFKIDIDWHNCIDIFKELEFNSFLDKIDKLPTGG